MLDTCFFLLLSIGLQKSPNQHSQLQSNSWAIYIFRLNQLHGVLAQQSIDIDKTKPTKDQKDLEKEIKKEEKDLEKEAKQNCEISGDRRGGKSKKCEPSIYEQAYPNVDFKAQDEKINEQLIKELQKDSRFKDGNVVK